MNKNIQLNFVLVKNCKCLYCNGQDTVHAVSMVFPDEVYFLAIEEFALNGWRYSFEDLRRFKIQLEDMIFNSEKYRNELETERKRLLKVVNEVIRGKLG
jgi:hypothetical protein